MQWLVRASRRSQRGLAAILVVVALLLGAAAVFYGLTKTNTPEIERDRKTEASLAIAKAALIGHAVSAPISNTTPDRLGDLPCPDTDDDGNAETTCGNAAGTTGQALRLGRLPWRTLGLPDLRDGDGERLWYAVSNNFKKNTRTNCNTPGVAGCLSSDTRGTITIRNSTSNVVHDATNADPAASGVIAVIISPGAVLRRQGATVVQDRTCTGSLCNPQGVCSAPVTNAPKCNPVNYLDTDGTEDNANFVDGSATNGFIQGVVRDTSGNAIVNDRLAVVTYQDLMPQLEKRVAAEVLKCVTDYAAANYQRYPWAAPVTTTTGTFADATNTYFGRIPDQPLNRTRLGSVTSTTFSDSALVLTLETACANSTKLCMSPDWPPTCAFPSTSPGPSWWNNWKQQVFYGVADAYKPAISYTQPTTTTFLLSAVPLPTGCPACLTINPPSPTADKKVVVILAGRRLPAVAGGQPRITAANQQNPANYLEGGNGAYPTFTQQPKSTAFNDLVGYK